MNFDGEFLKLGEVDVSALIERVKTIDDDIWNADSYRQQQFEAHRSTRSIKLMMDEDFRHTNPTIHPAYREYEDVVEPVLQHITRLFNTSLKAKRLRKKNGPGYFIRVLLVKLLAGGEIPEHWDQRDSLSRCHRIHIPLITNDQTLFCVGKTSKCLKPGEIWEINNRDYHSVLNSGTEDRIHLIVDYVLPGEKIIDIDRAKLTA